MLDLIFYEPALVGLFSSFQPNTIKSCIKAAIDEKLHSNKSRALRTQVAHKPHSNNAAA